MTVIKKSTASLARLWEFLTQNQARRQLVKNLTTKLNLAINRFHQISKTNKILIVLTVVLVLLFSQSLIWQDKKMQSLKTKEEYQILLTQLADRKNALEASLIYNDTARAKQLLKEIQAIYSSQGQKLNDKHIEVIIRQMFSRVYIEDAGEADLLSG